MGESNTLELLKREKHQFAECIKKHWLLSVSYILVIILYVLIVHDTRPICLTVVNSTFPEWLPHILFRSIIGFTTVLAFGWLTAHMTKPVVGWVMAALGSIGVILVVAFIDTPQNQYPVVIGAALSASSTFYMACLMLSLGCRIGVAQNLRCITIAAALAIPLAPVFILVSDTYLLYLAPALPLAIFALLRIHSKHVGRTRRAAKMSVEKLFVPKRFLATALFDGIVFGLYLAAGGSGGANGLLLMMTAAAISCSTLFYPIIIRGSTYNDILFRLAFPLGAAGLLLMFVMGTEALVPKVVFFASFVMRYITVYTLNIYHVSRYELPLVWVAGYADCARNIGQLLGFGIPAIILSASGISLSGNHTALLGAIVCLVASIYLQSESNDRTGWGHSRVDEEEALTDLERTCRRIASENALTKRECEVLTSLAQGNSQRRTSELLFIGTETVKTHSRNVYQKLGVHSKQELLDYVRARGPETR